MVVIWFVVVWLVAVVNPAEASLVDDEARYDGERSTTRRAPQACLPRGRHERQENGSQMSGDRSMKGGVADATGRTP